MIQRIQTVYLLIAAIAALSLYFFPIAWFYGETNTIQFFVYRLLDHVPANAVLFGSMFTLPLNILTVLMILVPFSSIFLYRNLKKQMLFVRVGVLIAVIHIALLFFFYIDRIATATKIEADYNIGIFFPIVSLVFLLLGLRGIMNDIKIIRSADRLR